ncbi:hypothetical protein G5V58_18505 [Nocardioides anomalus]|uniref:Uncharacterized protein n=1 Tax=Nocardioides anomalus TaxID=2712223 RepID=A0A6G6WH20_9ACTN|nr:hypothetical protein [Nocardioides anomalus]QIG44506.1 hypothetical protein G5V58_18505 [Nocardioides anomalus]
MTHDRLRELLRERVADETMPDVSARAWRRARTVRRRHRLGVVAGVAAATVAVSGGIAVLDPRPPAPPSSGDVGVSDRGRPDATYDGVPLWWGPDQLQERDLPLVDSPLPPDIAVGTASPERRDDPMDRAYAVFATGRSLTLVGPDGEVRDVEAPGLEEVTKANGYSYLPAPQLAPDGSTVSFRQPGGTAAVYDVARRAWGTDLAYGTSQSPPEPGIDTGAAQQYGPVVAGAASWGMGLQLPVRDPGTDLSGSEFMTWPGGVLAFTEATTDGTDTRDKNCCAVAGWLDADTVVYESRQTYPVLVAWRVGTHDFGVLTRIHGSYDTASYAL